jgi:hypothetical protein
MPTRYRVAAPSRAWRPASFGLTGRRRRYDTVSTFFSEIFGLTLKVFGDLSGHSELVVRGSLSDGNLLGFYLQQGRLVATLAVGQEKQTEEELQLLIKQRVVLDSDLLADPSTEISSLLKPAANER